MAHELRAGDFVPLDFELNFADPEQIAPITLSDGEVTLNMSGVADRVDGWLSNFEVQMNEDRERIRRLKAKVITPVEMYAYIGLLTALRVSHDSSDKRLSSKVETIP